MAAPAAPLIADVTEDTFEEFVVRQSMERPVVVDFWAPSCGPCRTLGPLLEKLTREHKGQVALAKVNVEECEQLAMYFQIEAIPAVKAIRNGEIVLEFKGSLPEASVREFFTRILPEPADPDMLKAHALEEGKPAEAEKLYRKLLGKDAANEEARLGLARVLIAQKKTEEVAVLLEPIDASGPHGEEAQRLKSLLSLQGLSANIGSDEADLRQTIAAAPDNAQARYELGCLLTQQGKHQEALEMLLSAGERDFTLASTRVREAMVQIFYALGPSHALSDQYRSKLARLLY